MYKITMYKNITFWNTYGEGTIEKGKYLLKKCYFVFKYFKQG